MEVDRIVSDNSLFSTLSQTNRPRETPPSSLYYEEELVVLDAGENQGGAKI